MKDLVKQFILVHESDKEYHCACACFLWCFYIQNGAIIICCVGIFQESMSNKVHCKKYIKRVERSYAKAHLLLPPVSNNPTVLPVRLLFLLPIPTDGLLPRLSSQRPTGRRLPRLSSQPTDEVELPLRLSHPLWSRLTSSKERGLVTLSSASRTRVVFLGDLLFRQQ